MKCTDCRFYRYLKTLDEHLCKHPIYGGTLPAEDVPKGCDEAQGKEADR